jgi:hypothetical protein
LPKPAPSLSLTKMIEATKLQPRTGLPLGVPPVTIPFGALIEPAGSDRDRERFKYLGELFECKRDLFLSATGGALEEAAAPGTAEPPPVAEKAAEPAAPAGPRLEWERLNSSHYAVRRAAVPGGWLVTLDGSAVIFVDDAKHRWDGGSVA